MIKIQKYRRVNLKMTCTIIFKKLATHAKINKINCKISQNVWNKNSICIILMFKFIKLKNYKLSNT